MIPSFYDTFLKALCVPCPGAGFVPVLAQSPKQGMLTPIQGQIEGASASRACSLPYKDR